MGGDCQGTGNRDTNRSWNHREQAEMGEGEGRVVGGGWWGVCVCVCVCVLGENSLDFFHLPTGLSIG